jgi:hypothetical protein
MNVHYMSSAMMGASFSFAVVAQNGPAAPGSVAECIVMMADVETVVDDTAMSSSARRQIDYMLEDLATHCAAKHFGFAWNTAQRIGAKIKFFRGMPSG